mgnify:FL=1
MRIRIDLKIFIFLILFILTRQIEIYALMMVFAIIHELGHMFSGILLGLKIEKMELMPYGVSVSFRLTTKDYNNKIKNGNLLELKKIIVAIAGPLTNLLIAIITYYLDIGEELKALVVYSNILLLLFNLIPVYPLDGGRILKSILHILYGKKTAEKYINNISFVLLLFLTFVSSIAIIYLKNIAIFLIIAFLWLMYIKEDKVYRRKENIYKLLEKNS